MINKVNMPAIRQQKKEESKYNNSFKGTPILGTLKFLNDEPAIGACAVDLFSMVIPRTAIEAKNRGKQSGIEAFFREVSSCVIHACVGLIGLGSAAAISGKFNKDNGVKAQKIFANSDTIKSLGELWKNSNGNDKEYFNAFLSSLSGLNGTKNVNISNSVKNEISEKLAELANKTDVNGKKELKDYILAKIVKDTGAEATYNLKNVVAIQNTAVPQAGKQVAVAVKGKAKSEITSSLSDLIDNAVNMSNAFRGKKISEIDKFTTALIKNKNASTLLGLGICATLCMSVQPLNKWLTKKRTGQDGFVGVDKNQQADNSKGFKALKTGLGVGFGAFALRTIGKYSDLLSNVQFNSKTPTINQFKGLYGLTIASRFMSARDKNELREGVIKDTLGFTNWLILGGMVSKLTARALGGENLINNPITNEGKKGIKYAFKWLTSASVKSFNEVLMPVAKNVTEGGNAIKFPDLYKAAEPAVKKQVRKVAVSQVAGYLYSGLVLGIGISKLNIFITKKLQQKKNSKQAQNIQQHKPAIDFNYIANLNKQKSAIFKDFN